MSRSTQEPIVPTRECQVCYGKTQYLYKWEHKHQCRECLRDLLLRNPRGAKRRRLLRLLDGPDWAQGEFNYGGNDDGR